MRSLRRYIVGENCYICNVCLCDAYDISYFVQLYINKGVVSLIHKGNIIKIARMKDSVDGWETRETSRITSYSFCSFHMVYNTGAYSIELNGGVLHAVAFE